MAYNVNIPVGTDPILQSAAQIRANFQAINQVFAENHVPLTAEDETTVGMHNIVVLRKQTGGDPTTTANQVALYNKLVSSVPNLFFRPSSNQTAIQLTYPSIVNTGLMQYSFMAGPFIIFYGFISTPTNGQVVTLSPGSSLIYADLTMAYLNPDPGGVTAPATAAATLLNTPANSFTIKYATLFNFALNPNGGVFYLAVGLP